MKTEKQIKVWLEKQCWYDRYKENLTKQKLYDVEYFLIGKGGKGTITKAFIWDKTKEGAMYWRKVAIKFDDWYNDLPEPKLKQRILWALQRSAGLIFIIILCIIYSLILKECTNGDPKPILHFCR